MVARGAVPAAAKRPADSHPGGTGNAFMSNLRGWFASILSVSGWALLAAQEPPATVSVAAPEARLSDAPVAAWRRELLELGFAAASAMPVNPHRKNRARAQEEVFEAALALGQEVLAASLLERMEDGWRRGAGSAALAVHCVERGAAAAAEPLLAQARNGLTQAGDDLQPWRRDRIRARLARAELLLGREAAAKASLAGIDPAQVGEFEVALARTAPAEAFAAQLAAFDQVCAAGNFDAIRSAMQVCVSLYDRYHADAERAAQVEQRLVAGYAKLPHLARLESVLEAVAVAVAHDQRSAAARLLQRCEEWFAGGNWLPDDEYPLRGRLAQAWARAGDAERAKRLVAEAVAKFYGERDRIPDVFRARGLRQLALASHLAGDAAESQRLLQAAVEEGLRNPNSRPRADDLVALCCLLAREGWQPTSALTARLAAIQQGLGQPW